MVIGQFQCKAKRTVIEKYRKHGNAATEHPAERLPERSSLEAEDRMMDGDLSREEEDSG